MNDPCILTLAIVIPVAMALGASLACLIPYWIQRAKFRSFRRHHDMRIEK